MDVLFAIGRLASKTHSTLRGRSAARKSDVSVVLQAAMDEPDMLPMAEAWKDGARVVPVVLVAPGGDKLAGVLVFSGPFVSKDEPVGGNIFAAARAVAGMALRGGRNDIVIECVAQPREMVLLRRRG
ncbi:hypothetical protein WV31_10230 [Magnetospirillum sp. ME-1]|uniref:hypothetical protein n=1 Tax=Magnetospirillum sp. ME-1 TaxID=1639348 RepID=UPI000A17C111|nr:hypothetical protein [Magnetospirillum sp. ME-1]ARJ66003.1 hypothetical protein WV31_10230 [Magnetospirillum sp. ME-1]